jgi:creatinine amidohydrolase
VQLALDPTRVRLDRAAAGATGPLADLMPAMRESGVIAVSPNGVLGDPDGAAATDGEALLAAALDDLAATLTKWTGTE